MHHHIQNIDAEKSLQQMASPRPPLVYLEPDGLFNTKKVFAIVAVVAFAAAVLAATFWPTQPDQPAAVAIKSLPTVSGLPAVAGQRKDSAALLSPLSAAAGASADKDFYQIDNLNGGELAAAFNELYKRAQAGDSTLTYALASRLRACSSNQRLEQQNLAATIEIAGTPDWAQTLDESWRQRCIGLSVVQLDKAAALQALAVKQGHPRALLEHASQSLNALELVKQDAVTAGQPISLTPQQIESVAASVRTLDALAQSGNYGALDTLAGLYAKGALVDADGGKFLVYQLVAQHDWAQPAQLMSKSPMLASQEEAESNQKALAQATALFNSCCANKEKTR